MNGNAYKSNLSAQKQSARIFIIIYYKHNGTHWLAYSLNMWSRLLGRFSFFLSLSTNAILRLEYVGQVLIYID